MVKKTYVVAYHWVYGNNSGEGNMVVVSKEGIDTIESFSRMVDSVRVRAAAAMGHEDAENLHIVIINYMPLRDETSNSD